MKKQKITENCEIINKLNSIQKQADKVKALIQANTDSLLSKNKMKDTELEVQQQLDIDVTTTCENKLKIEKSKLYANIYYGSMRGATNDVTDNAQVRLFMGQMIYMRQKMNKQQFERELLFNRAMFIVQYIDLYQHTANGIVSDILFDNNWTFVYISNWNTILGSPLELCGTAANQLRQKPTDNYDYKVDINFKFPWFKLIMQHLCSLSHFCIQMHSPIIEEGVYKRIAPSDITIQYLRHEKTSLFWKLPVELVNLISGFVFGDRLDKLKNFLQQSY